jgi:hypothetical protein
MTADLSSSTLETTDIVVVGGGMAGVMAALAGKTPGNRVLLLEPSNVLGGQGTAGGVAGFCGDTKRVNAPFAELIARLAAHDLIEPYRPDEDRRAYDLEWCAFFLQEMVTKRGIKILLHTRVIAARASNGLVTELTAATAGGLVDIHARFVIDASGSCVVPVLTGFPVVHEGANRQLPMSLYFTLWDTGRMVKPVLPEGCPRWVNEEEIPMTSLHRYSTGKVEVKMKVVGFDAADGASRSAAEIFARRHMHALIYFLQTVGYRGRKLDTHVLASVSRGIGIREERRIVGEHVLTEAEARAGTLFDDAVAVNTYHIDFHWPDRMQRAGTGITDMLDPHHLPLRMMIPKGAKNLLVPGRGASGDQTAMSAFRVMAVVAQMGFAAGHAARQCIENGTNLGAIDVRALQAEIEAGGQSLNLSDYGEYLRCDLFVHEPVPLAAGGAKRSVHAPKLRPLDNARFLATWQDSPSLDAPRWQCERREKKWSAPIRVADTGSAKSAGSNASVPAGEIVILDDGAQARITLAETGGALNVAVSANQGASWAAPKMLALDGRVITGFSAVATRTGLALLYVADGTRLMFWHGSVDRIVNGPPVASSVRLDAPPDQVHEARAAS